MYAFLTHDNLILAFEGIVKDAVTHANACGVTNKLAGCFVVLDPMTGEVMYEFEVNPSHEKAEIYRQIARKKAVLSYRTGLPSRVVQNEEPWLLLDDDIRYGGSAVRGIGSLKLIVGFSGVEPEYDEMFAGQGADAVIAICRNRRAARDKNPQGDFVSAELGEIAA